MNQLTALIRKEALENWRNYKCLWLPTLFVILGMMQPLTLYYMEDMLVLLGGLPEGANFAMPTLTAEEVVVNTLNQFSQIGMFAIVLSFMSTYTNERKTGEALLILVKPVTHWSYWLSKWVVALALVIGSFIAGLLAALYYISLLYGSISFSSIVFTVLIYGLWLMFIVTVTLFIGTIVKSSAVVSLLSILLMMLVMLFPVLFGEGALWTPAGLLVLVEAFLLNDPISFKPVWITMSLIILLLLGGMKYLTKKEWSI
ncbi:MULTISPECIES: ABC transporter permease [Shouchella]|uniref:ABC transporter permease n=2 Tax=Shouchella TaxID=2893057 RepID=A0ABY7W1A8_9BACI|nr:MULTISPECIES: ABC transporter permease subunit [Shouchella]MED4127671.1 ABC transporter permease [Shouchella miscanthi]WDF02644.1 ABC transporter permease [Shouchella hunanensis]GAF23205.1 hypothetical protein JCM19047_3008 [Bacillus sp. JCM 19047]